MQKETSQELLRGERHLSLLITVRIVLPQEGDLVMVKGHEAVVADGNAMGVAGQISQHVVRATKRRLSVDDPLLPK